MLRYGKNQGDIKPSANDWETVPYTNHEATCMGFDVKKYMSFHPCFADSSCAVLENHSIQVSVFSLKNS